MTSPAQQIVLSPRRPAAWVAAEAPVIDRAEAHELAAIATGPALEALLVRAAAVHR